jgi:hypothetical protein
LLSESGFVLEPDLNLLILMGIADRLDLLNDVFLKAAWTLGSVFRCRGRGIRQL